MSGIKQICGKELARVFKDKKMIFSVFFLPVIIMVGIMTLVSSLSSNAQEDVESHKAIVYLQNAPAGFEEFLKAADKECDVYTVSDRAETEGMIKNGEADLLIEFPEGFLDEVTSYQTGAPTPQVKTYYNPSEDYSRAAYDTISNGVLESYRQLLLSDRVEDMEGLTVFTVNSDNPEMVIQDEEKASGKVLGMMLPYFVTILLFAGAMGIGTDMVAGKRKGALWQAYWSLRSREAPLYLEKYFH